MRSSDTYYSTINGPSLDRNLFIGCLDRAIYAFVFISFGYVLSFYKEALLYGKLRWLIFIVGLLAIYWKVRYWNHLPIADVRSMNFENFYKTRSLIVTFSGVAFIFATSIIIHKINWLAEYFDCLGEKSFHIMALHPLGIYLFKWFTKLSGLEFIEGYHTVIASVGCLLSGLAFSLICIKIWDFAFAKKSNSSSQDIINPISYIPQNIYKLTIMDGRK